MQVGADGTTLHAIAMFNGLMADAQSLWPILSLELYAQLQVARRRRKLLGRIPAECWADHANVVRVAYKPEAEAKHTRWVADIESDGSRLRNMAGRLAVMADALSRQLAVPPRRLRDLVLEDFLAEFEGEGIQCDAVPLHAPPSAGAPAD